MKARVVSRIAPPGKIIAHGAFSRNAPQLALRLDVAEVNGEPAMLAFDGETLAGVLCFEIVDNRIAELRVVANPDKLRFISEQLSRPAGLPGS